MCVFSTGYFLTPIYRLKLYNYLLKPTKKCNLIKPAKHNTKISWNILWKSVENFMINVVNLTTGTSDYSYVFYTPPIAGSVFSFLLFYSFRLYILYSTSFRRGGRGKKWKKNSVKTNFIKFNELYTEKLRKILLKKFV